MDDIRDTTQLETCLSEWKVAPFRIRQIQEWLWKKGAQTFDEMTNLPLALRQKLIETFTFHKTTIDIERRSTDGTAKFLFSLHDGIRIEGVLIPTETRVTACISSQAGCPLQCTFCATGHLGFIRNLHYAEIFDQYMLMNRKSVALYGKPISNIVYMGMGEPLLNLDHVVRSVELLTGKMGQALSPSRITISTVGLTDGIRALATRALKVGLALSLHSADEVKRLKIMPITRTNRLQELQQALSFFAQKEQSRITIEYLMLRGINDTLADAEKLALFCKAFPVKINIINYNDSCGDFTRSHPETVRQFVAYLERKNLIVNMRQSRGEDIEGACGQLAGRAEDERINP
jgi:23S rRNA (adenine2503-C2)-methyltransferase